MKEDESIKDRELFSRILTVNRGQRDISVAGRIVP